MGRQAEPDVDPTSRRVSEYISGLVDKRGSIRQLAAVSSRSLNYYAIRLRGEASLTMGDLAEIAAYLGLPTRDLFLQSLDFAESSDN